MDIRVLRTEGLNKTAVADRLGLDRKTVAKYWDGPCDAPEAPRYQERARKTDPYQEYITQRLLKWPELEAERIYQEIVAQGFTGSKRSVRRVVAELRPKKNREFKPFETLPGEQAQVDWGHMGHATAEGARVPLYAFVFSLSWSRVRYVEFVTLLNMATFLACMHRAFEYIGGVPSEVVFDNAKTVVSERVGSVVRYNENLLRLAATYGFQPKACWTHDPESKGKVESNVKYVKRGFYYARDWNDLIDLNSQVMTWCNEIANQKVHGTTGDVPFVRLEEERAHLKPLNVSEPLGIVEFRKATKTQLISIEGNQYSVPAAFARQKVTFRRYEDYIELLNAGQVVERIGLVAGRGKRHVEDRHYPAHAQKTSRASHPLQARFEELAPSAKTYLQGLSRSRTGHLREQMEKITALGNQYDDAAIEAAMERSLRFGAFGYGHLKRILERQQKAPRSLPRHSRATCAEERLLTADTGVDVEKRDLAYYGRVGQ